VNTRGVALRHPIIHNSPIAYPNPATGLSGLISGGEGALYWYRFTGRFNAHSQPVFADPTPVLEADALLYAGSLPAPTIVDWDGDGRLDLAAGNSGGRILFFRNHRTSQAPAFATGIALEAGGRQIHVQPGYKGDIQGPGEARWGYVSTNVVDWNGDGLPGILMGDSLSRHTVFINRGTRRQPPLDPERAPYLDGLDLHGTWRVRGRRRQTAHGGWRAHHGQLHRRRRNRTRQIRAVRLGRRWNGRPADRHTAPSLRSQSTNRAPARGWHARRHGSVLEEHGNQPGTQVPLPRGVQTPRRAGVSRPSRDRSLGWRPGHRWT
jgi:hypothetical protein